MGGRVIGFEVAKEILATFIATPFLGSYHCGRVEKIHALETKA